MGIIVVVGAPPHFVKVAPLMPVLAEVGIDAAIAHTFDAATKHAHCVTALRWR